MKLTVTVHQVFDNPESNVKGTASVAFGGQFAAHGFTIMNGKKGLFVNMPSKMNDEGEYVATIHPITKDARNQLNGAILEAYAQKLEDIANGVDESQDEDGSEQDDGEDESEDFEEIADDGFEVNM